MEGEVILGDRVAGRFRHDQEGRPLSIVCRRARGWFNAGRGACRASICVASGDPGPMVRPSG
eukprot:16442656-Heterocapsa_arctica.AAC.1